MGNILNSIKHTISGIPQDAAYAVYHEGYIYYSSHSKNGTCIIYRIELITLTVEVFKTITGVDTSSGRYTIFFPWFKDETLYYLRVWFGTEYEFTKGIAVFTEDDLTTPISYTSMSTDRPLIIPRLKIAEDGSLLMYTWNHSNHYEYLKIDFTDNTLSKTNLMSVYKDYGGESPLPFGTDNELWFFNFSTNGFFRITKRSILGDNSSSIQLSDTNLDLTGTFDLGEQHYIYGVDGLYELGEDLASITRLMDFTGNGAVCMGNEKAYVLEENALNIISIVGSEEEATPKTVYKMINGSWTYIGRLFDV